ncbi:hypothetical protein ACFQV2_07550 [Actinokineospora soli]|uniref:Uncharacterized protein n=1 Tax=Actinokineospora soli TaxID=1048753 RepID=A0ABW2TJ85_9PSEU
MAGRGEPAARAFTQAAVAQVGLSYCWGGATSPGRPTATRRSRTAGPPPVPASTARAWSTTPSTRPG